MGCGILFPRDYNLSPPLTQDTRKPRVQDECGREQDVRLSYLCGDETEFLELEGYHSDSDLTESDSEDDSWALKSHNGPPVKVRRGSKRSLCVHVMSHFLMQGICN